MHRGTCSQHANEEAGKLEATSTSSYIDYDDRQWREIHRGSKNMNVEGEEGPTKGAMGRDRDHHMEPK